jgi:hypothetical protein
VKCRHPRAQRQRLIHSDWDCCYYCNVCRRCGEWLSLGPSNDAGCAVEIRAAKLAADIAHLGWTVLRRDSLEFAGWNGDGWSAWEDALLDPKYLAGYLARCIATHEDPNGQP